MKGFNAWLETLISTLASTDQALADEIRAIRGSRSFPAAGSRSLPASVRNIVLRVGRPVLSIVGNAPRLDFNDSESAVWRARLQASRAHLSRAAQAVGRIEVTGLSGHSYVGTGWLVDRNTVVTNRHVALAFGRLIGARFTFKQGNRSRPMTAAIDFLEETGRAAAREFPIVEIVHIEAESGPDFALLRVENRSGTHTLAPPIALAGSPARPEQPVAVIGYPARDSRVADAQLMQSIFGDVYDKKRLSPGQVTKARKDVVFHDCSTLGGNSGSVVLDLATGEAVGLHFAGRFLEANYAVPASVIAARVEQVLRPKPGRRPARPSHGSRPGKPAAGQTTPAGTTTSPELIVESVSADYVGRTGYAPAFVGPKIPLPVVRNKSDILTFPWNGRRESVLKYEHFSVVMSRSRRLCIYSACNLDGSSPRRFKRPSWRFDGRIPVSQQIKEECYGNEPLFARGHMTRREDPIWGTPEEAALGNIDSMHVTNTVPQMQPFNAGIWLALESYALDNARSDRMRISVFTGPFLLADDPVRKGVQIPRSFWKVIAFIHDETRKICATGYTMSQEDFLRDEEFVFGKHQTSQRRIADIERDAGLSFGQLSRLDPLERGERGLAAPLTDPSQIRFV
jgi:endonuclease G, mitochondrial